MPPLPYTFPSTRTTYHFPPPTTTATTEPSGKPSAETHTDLALAETKPISIRRQSDPLPTAAGYRPPRLRDDHRLLSPHSLPPTLCHVEAYRARPPVSPGVYVVKGDNDSRRHCWAVEGRMTEMTFRGAAGGGGSIEVSEELFASKRGRALNRLPTRANSLP